MVEELAAQLDQIPLHLCEIAVAPGHVGQPLPVAVLGLAGLRWRWWRAQGEALAAEGPDLPHRLAEEAGVLQGMTALASSWWRRQGWRGGGDGGGGHKGRRS